MVKNSSSVARLWNAAKKNILYFSLILISGLALAYSGWNILNSSMDSFMAGGVSGSVYRDYDGDGFRDPGEPLVAGVTVTAYDATGSSCGSAVTTSVSAPNYMIMTCAGQVRVEFSIESTTDCIDPLLDYTSTNGGTYGTSVQFVNASLMPTVNFALNNPADYNKGGAATNVFVPCYNNGDPLLPGTMAANGSWFVGFPYNNSGTTPPAQVIKGDTIGATWGVAYSKQAKKLFSSAFIKRHVGLGKLGSGGIYMLTPTTTSFVASSFYNMDAQGHRTRAAGTPAFGPGMSYNITGTPGNKITYTGAINSLSGTPEGMGVVGTNAQRGLPGASISNYDASVFGQVGKVGLGDLEISDDGKFLFVVNLYSKKLFRLELNDAYAPTSVIDVDSFNLPATSCPNGVLRPYATKFYRGKLYIGAVCTGENGGSTTVDNNTGPPEPTDLHAYVFELISPTTAPSGSFSPTPVFDMPLNYKKGASMTWTTPDFGLQWYPWTDSLRTEGINRDRTYPTPVLSDLEFTDRGDLLLAFSDRTANQYGWGNYRWLSGNPSDLILTVSGGDIIVAGLNCGSGVYTRENAGMYTSDGILNNNTGAANMEGPGGDEFFDQENFGSFHMETHLGAMAILKGDGKVITTAMDPTAIREGGTIKFSTSNGVKSSAYRLFLSVNDISTGTFGKANGLGDIEVSGIEPPLELGNRIWVDTDGDGTQDPGEAPIPNVTVQIFADFDNNGMPDIMMALGTDVTDANGNYFFDTTNITDGDPSAMGNQKGPQPNKRYLIRIGAVDWTGGVGIAELTNYSLTSTDSGEGLNPDLNDNDANIPVSTIPTISYLTGDWGENNHTLDFGFVNSPPAVDTVDLALRKTIDTIINNSINTNLNNGDTVKFKIQLFNQGDVSMDSVNVTDYLPAGFQFINATGTGQINEGWDGTDPSNPVYKWRSNVGDAGSNFITQATSDLPTVFNNAVGSAVTPVTFLHTPGNGANRLMIVGISAGSDDSAGEPIIVDSVFFQGIKLQLQGSIQSPGAALSNDNDVRSQIFSLVNPPSGLGTVQVYINPNTPSGQGNIGDLITHAVTFNGVDQINPLGAFQTQTGTGANASGVFSSAAGELLYTIISLDQGATLSNPGAPQTTLFDDNDSHVSGVAITEVGAVSVTSSFTSDAGDWAMGAISIKPYIEPHFNPGDTIELCIYTTLQPIPGIADISDFTNYSEISYARDTAGINQSANDIDSPLNNNPNDNAGGQEGSPADDHINGNGTGAIGGGTAATDQDNHDPAFLNIFDLALKKTIDTGSISDNGVYGIGTNITFNIAVTNQGTDTATNIEITDYLPCGLSFFLAPANPGWTRTGSLATYTAPGPLAPGQSLIVPIILQISPADSCSPDPLDYVNVAEISEAMDDEGNTYNSDVDSDYDQIKNNDAGVM